MVPGMLFPHPQLLDRQRGQEAWPSHLEQSLVGTVLVIASFLLS